MMFFLFGCSAKKSKVPFAIRVNYNWLDSIKLASDSAYIKKYATNKFANATYYLKYKEAIICQVMKDTEDTIRQIIITKNNKRNFVAEYYANGQLVANQPLDSFGQYNGAATYYYQNGLIESKGDYAHGLKKGIWENYSLNGKLTVKAKYDCNGNINKLIEK